MKEHKLLSIILLSFIFASWTIAEPLLYEDFELYDVGLEGTWEPNDIWNGWWYGEEGNPYLMAYADDSVSCTGNKSMRLESPLRNGTVDGYDGQLSSAQWGVQIRNNGSTTDARLYNAITAMVKTNSDSNIVAVAMSAKDSFMTPLTSKNTYIDIPRDGQWHRVIGILDGNGDLEKVREALVFFTIEPNAPEGISQLWIDDIKFERVLEVKELLSVDSNGPYATEGGGTEKLTFVMLQEPSADVTFTLDPNGALNLRGAGYDNPVNIVFTNSNWNIKQEIVAEVNSSAFSVGTITASVSSVDPTLDEAIASTFSTPILGQYGAAYVISPETPTVRWAGSDNTGNDLCNGWNEGSFFVSADGFAVDWVEWAPGDVPGLPAYAEITFDFKCAKDVNTIDILHTGFEVNLYPGSFDISYSTDGINFTTPTNYEAFSGNGWIATSHLEVNAKSVRYVKMRINCLNNDPAKWFLLSEVEFNRPPELAFPRYTIDPATKPLGNHKDLNQTNLMNGAIMYENKNTDWVFFDDASLQPYDSAILYVDYGKVKEFSNITMNYITGNATIGGVTTVISTPQLVKLSFSDDGATYGTPILVTDGDGWYATGTTGKGRTDKMAFAKQTGRYVKVEVVGDGVGTLAIGEIILTNRPQVTYVIDSSTPVYGGSGAQGDVATDYFLQCLKAGDLTNTHIPTIVGAYGDSDWVEWAPSVVGKPAYAIITFDLKSAIKVKNVAITYCAWPSDPPSGVNVPGGFDVAYSTTGGTNDFSPFQNANAVFLDDSEKQTVFTTTFDLPQTNARYVKLKVHCMDDDPTNWLYLAEFKFNVFTGDINDDGVVDMRDIRMMSSQWLQMGLGLSGDIVNDQIVNFEDFAELAMQWMN
ncbi:MAG: discoidin domain-containing protein [Phycisphaerales bacterium]